MAKVRKLYTLDQLAKFCEDNNFVSFSSKDTGYTLSVQVPGNLNFSEKEDEDLLYTTVKVCHTERNRNNSYISEENMTKALPTLKYKPLLASIIETDDGLDFNSHDMEFVEDENGELKVVYIEKQVGTFTVDEPYLEYDESNKKTYVIATAVIPREYTEAASIIERKGGTKVSCELAINKMSYNAKEKYLELEDFVFSGVALLGEHVEEGMIGSRLDIQDFSTENNSVRFERDEKMLEMLAELSKKVDALANFSIDKDFQEGGNKMFEELLEKYGKTAEDIDFDYSEMSDEELEAAFAEAFESDPTPEDPADPEPEDDPEGGEPEDSEEEPEAEPEEKFSKTFEISHDDIRCALYGLIAPYEEADNEWYFISAVYDDHFVFESWSGQIWGCKYSKNDDNVALDGERFKLFREYVTETEYAQLQEMRSNYSSAIQKLASYESEPQKLEILNSEDYASIANTEEFAELKKEQNHFELSVEEVTAQADAILLKYAKKPDFKFSADIENKVSTKKQIPVGKKITKKGPYGNIFNKEN